MHNRRGHWARFSTQKRHCPQRPKTRQYFGLQQILQIHVLQIRVLQIRVLQIRVLQIQSVFYKSNPVRVLQYAEISVLIFNFTYEMTMLQ